MLRIRPYRKNDSKQIACWCRDSISFYQWSEGRLGDFPVSPERIEQAVSGRIDNEKYFPFTAFDENGAVGFFTLRQPGEDPEELSFGYVILRPESRGKGYGKQMLKLGIKFAFELYGITKVSLEVFRYIFGYYNTQRINSFNAGGLPPVALRTSTGLAHHAA